MSADTTLVIAAHDFDDHVRRWSVAVVQAAEGLFDEGGDYGLKKARSAFFKPGQIWLSSLPRIKQVAAILAEDLNAAGGLEYQERVVVLITHREVVQLSARKGVPLPKGHPSLYR